MEDILQTIMENTNTQLMYLDPQFNFVRANSAYVRSSGHSWEELIGRNHFDLFPNPENRAIFERARDTGQPVAFHARPFEYADQPERGVTYWDWTLTPVKDGSGQVQGLVCSLLDVTEQVRAEQEREQLLAENRRQRAFLEQLVETAPIGIAVLHGPDHRYELVNPYHQSIPGTPNVPMLGRTIGEVFPDVVAQGALRLVDEVYRTGRTVSIREHRVSVGPGREQTYWNVDHVPLSGPDGKVERVLILANEVTEYVQARTQIEALAAQALHQTEELSTIFAAITDAVTVYDRDGVPVRANPAAVAGYGLDPVGVERTILARKLQVRHLDGRRLAVDELPTTHALQGETVIEQRLLLTTAAGQERIVLVSAAPLLAGSQVSGAVMVWRDITERERTRDALRESEEKLRKVIDLLPIGISVLDQDRNVRHMNPALSAILGMPAEALLRGNFRQRIYLRADGTEMLPEELPSARAFNEQKMIRDVEIGIVKEDGKLVWVSVSAVPLPFSDWGVVVATADITERKQAQEALRRYAERLQALHLIDQALLTAQSAEEIANTALPYVRRMMPCLRIGLALFDFEADEMRLLAVDTEGATQLGKGWRGSLKMTSFLEKIKEGEPHVVEDLEVFPSPSPFLEILRAEGVRAYVQIPLVVQGSLIGSLNLGMSSPGCPAPEGMDIAREVAAQLALALHHARLHEQVQRYADELEQRVAQRTAELQASEARFRSIFEGSAIGIALADAQGRVLASNPALQEMLGYSEQELRYRTLAEFVHPDDVAANEALHQELTAGIRDGGKLESRYIRKGGQVICGDLTVSLARGARDAPLFTVSMVEDVTEWKEIQEALLWTEKLTIAGRLGASLAHEINNPLQSVIGCLGLADKVLAEGGDASRYLQVAREELRRAARTVAQLRDLHRLPKPEKRKSTDVNALLEHVLLLSRTKCEEHRIQVIWKPADDLPLLLLASDQMRQVFLNLVLNALDALPKGGKLEVNTARTGQPAGASIVFADNGSGIAPDAVSHLFDPFFSTKPQGLGLGLFTSRRIVEEHGGRIDVVSQVGKGTTFTVWLPE